MSDGSCQLLSEHLQVSQRQMMVSREMLSDLCDLWHDITHKRWTAIVVSTSFWAPGMHRASSDASGALEKGWVVHSFGAFAHGLWAPHPRRLIAKRKISINALELLTAAAAVVLIWKEGRVQSEGRYVLKCHNRTACAVDNFGVAGSTAMREALRIWKT